MKIFAQFIMALFLSIFTVNLNAEDVVPYAHLYLYGVNHPEWLSHISETTSDSNGAFSFEQLQNAKVNGDAYKDGDPIPAGNYTMLIYKPSSFDPVTGVTTEPIVAVTTVFKISGTLTTDSFEAEPSDVTPNVTSMFGVSKNTDGTNTWGTASISASSQIQITFNMAMSMSSIQKIIVSTDKGTEVDGVWVLSLDWKTASFVPASKLEDGTYTVTVPERVASVYSNAMGYDATGTFTLVENTTKINIVDGWQLLGTDTTINTFSFKDTTCVKLVWAYNGSAWEVYNADGEIYEGLDAYNNLSSIPAQSGFWVLSKGECSVEVPVSTETEITTFSIKSGWQLLGSSKALELSSFDSSKCIDYMWAYDSSNPTSPAWKYYVANGESYNTGMYTKFDSIKENSGFWVKGNDSCSVSLTKGDETPKDTGSLSDTGVSTLSSGTTDASISGGVGKSGEDKGLNGVFSTSDALTAAAIIKIDSSDVGSAIDLLALAGLDQGSGVMWSQKNISGAWETWDGTTSNLVAAEEIEVAKSTHTINVVQGLTGLTGSFTIFVGYRNSGGEIIYNSTPITFTVK